MTATATKRRLIFEKNLSAENVVGNIFEREMFIRTLPTNLHQIFRKKIQNSLGIVKNMKDPDDNFSRSS